MNFTELLSITLILFAVIDIPGSLPIVISMKEKGKKIESGKATIVAGIVMVLFLQFGEKMLGLFGVDIASFAIAGGLIILLLGMEMILGVTLFKDDTDNVDSSIVPIAFPIVAGAGTITTILSLKAEHNNISIFIAILINLAVVYLLLRSSNLIGRILGKQGTYVLRKAFGIICLAIGIKLIKANLGIF